MDGDSPNEGLLDVGSRSGLRNIEPSSHPCHVLRSSSVSSACTIETNKEQRDSSTAAQQHSTNFLLNPPTKK